MDGSGRGRGRVRKVGEDGMLYFILTFLGGWVLGHFFLGHVLLTNHPFSTIPAK